MERDAPKGAINSLDMTEQAPNTDNRFSSAVRPDNKKFRGGGLDE